MTTREKKEADEMMSCASYCRHNNFNALDEYIDNIDSFVSVTSKDQAGNTLLHIACQNGNKRIVKMLLRRGARLDEVNTSGFTSLHFCYSFGYQDLGQYLISKGANDGILANGVTCYEMMLK
jgi:ankyrin repeat protein